MYAPGRLATSLRRNRNGEFEPVPAYEAAAEIAERLGDVIGSNGPDAIGLFMGTQHNFATLTGPMVRGWFRGLGSHKLFSTMTIDQSAKWIVRERMGQYLGGRQKFHDSDVWILAGTNPLVSVNGGDGDGALMANPSASLRAARDRGLELIVIDPRRTETASRADLHLQTRPGFDAVIFAGILNVILTEELHDREFCDRYVDGLDELAKAVSGVTPDLVERVCDVPSADLVTAARMFGRASSGMVSTGTGVCMGPDSNVAEHLAACLNAVCGRFAREGDSVEDRSALSRSVTPRAEVAPPGRSWESGFHSRVGGVGTLNGQLPSGILADEILQPGVDQVRALLVSGGNPASALPDKDKTLRALRSLDLLVCVDTHMSETAQLADYVIAPTTMYERADHTAAMEASFTTPYAQYTPPLVDPPPGVIEDWQFWFRLATEMHIDVKFAGRVLDPGMTPTSDELLAMLAERGRVPLADVVAAGGGLRPPPRSSTVLPPSPDAAENRLQLFPQGVAHELEVALSRSGAVVDEFSLRLVVRRERELMNSVGRGIPGLARRTFNPAFVHPADLRQRGISEDDAVIIRSRHGSIQAVAVPDETVRRGIVSMTHCYGSLDSDADPHDHGSNVAALLTCDTNVQTINHMPTMTAVPVTFDAVSDI